MNGPGARRSAGHGEGFRRALTFYDLTNITVGAIVGADIYIAAAITAGLLGPASLLAWLAAGLLATLVALTLAECARLVPQVGGPYAYTARAFGPLPGFLAGWSMWISEITAIPVFAIAFTNYLSTFVVLDDWNTHALRIAFILTLTGVNILSVRAAGRLNDILTALKLAPLVMLIVAGFAYVLLHPALLRANLTPFAPFGFESFPSALVLVFWAYVGFELSTVPAGEVEDPSRTIPRALSAGMAIVMCFYLLTNFVLYALVPHGVLAASTTPLAIAGTVLFGTLGSALIAGGAIVSVSGSDESDILGSSRLLYAMAADGLLPHRLATIHERFHTPHTALAFQAAIALPLTFFDGVAALISFSVFNLAFSFLLCALALLRLHRTPSGSLSIWQRLLPVATIAISTGLIAAVRGQDRVVGTAVVLAGACIYAVSAPGRALPAALAHVTDVERALERVARRRMRFLGGLVGWLGGRRTPPRRPPQNLR